MAFGGKPYNGNGIAHDKFAETTEDVAWPKTPYGLPVKIPQGAKRDFKGDEIDDFEVEINFKSKMFSLWKDEDKLEFDRVQDFCANRVYFVLVRRDQWIEEKSHLMVWLEWVELYKVAPK